MASPQLKKAIFSAKNGQNANFGELLNIRSLTIPEAVRPLRVEAALQVAGGALAAVELPLQGFVVLLLLLLLALLEEGIYAPCQWIPWIPELKEKIVVVALQF